MTKASCRGLGAIIFLSLFVFLCGSAGTAFADGDILILQSGATSPISELLATGLFDSVDEFPVSSATPLLNDLTPYDAVLAFTNSTPSNPSGLGDVLADYVDAGGHVVICTYGFSNPWAITGRITTSGYSPLTNLGTNGNVSGNLVAIAPADPIFSGINLSSVIYFWNDNFAHPGLDSGATLLATDGAGINMIARNSSGSVYGANLYPDSSQAPNNQELFNLIANMLNVRSAPPAPPQPIPTLSEWGMIIMSLILAGSAIWMIRRRQVA